MAVECRSPWSNGCANITHLLRCEYKAWQVLSPRKQSDTFSDFMGCAGNLHVTLILAYVWIKYNPSLFFLWVIKVKNSPQRRWSRAIPEVAYLLPVPSMIFILKKKHLFLKRVHWRCHPSTSGPTGFWWVTSRHLNSKAPSEGSY